VGGILRVKGDVHNTHNNRVQSWRSHRIEVDVGVVRLFRNRSHFSSIRMLISSAPLLYDYPQAMAHG